MKDMTNKYTNALQKMNSVTGWPPWSTNAASAIKKLLLLLFTIALPFISVAVDIRNKQSGAATMSATDTDITVTLSQSVNMTTSFLLFTYRVDHDDAEQVLVGGELTSSTTVEFHRNTSGSTVEIEWQVVDFASGVTVQRGWEENAGTTTDVSISSVALNNSFATISYLNNGTTMGADDMMVADITSPTNLSLVSGASGVKEVFWQVIECTDCSVQKVTPSLPDGSTSTTATFTAVDMARTLVLTSQRVSGNLDAYDLPRTEFTNSTTLTYTREGDQQDFDFLSYIIEFTDGTTSVQHGTMNFSASDATQTATITSVVQDVSLVLSAGPVGIQGSTTRNVNNDDNPGSNWFSFNLLSDNSVSATRASSTYEASVSYQVIEFSYNPPTTWYSYQSGNWSDPNVWTLDGSVSPLLVNPSSEIPDAGDNVVITSGRTVTTDINNITIGSLEVINRLDLAATSGHDFTVISGTGRILMAGSSGIDNFPSGDVSSFADAVNGGTVEVYGSGITLDQARTFNNVEVSMATATGVVTQLADITLNGDLTITRGSLQINDNTATTPLDLEVGGDVLVGENGSMSVGTGNAYVDNTGGTYGDYHQGFHEMVVHGNFTNNGGVRFTNQTVPDYATVTTTGAASLVFTGTTNNTFSCNSTTDLYNLVIDKGTDQTYEVSLNTATKADFALFGTNNNGWNRASGNEANPETQKALWIKAGTLRITGNTVIPSLSEGGRDFSIGQNAALVLDGENVEVHNTANEDSGWAGFSHGTPTGVDNGSSQQSLYPFGTLRVNDGYYWLGEAEAINFRDEAPGVVEVNGGELSATQIAISSSASSGSYTFTLNGGVVRLTDYMGRADNTRAMLHLDDPNSVFTMTGGELIIEGISGFSTGGILISSDPGNISVTGGTVRTDYVGTMEISTTAPFYDFTVETHTVDLQSDLSVLNDVVINTGTTRTSGSDTYGGYLDLCPDGTTCYNLEVGRNLTIEDQAVLDVFNNVADNAGSATVTFNGTENGILHIGDITTLSNSLTGYDDPGGSSNIYDNYRFPLYSMIIDKPGDTLQLQANGPVNDLSGSDVISGNKNIRGTKSRLIYVRDQFAIRNGATLNQIDPNNDELGYSMRLYSNTLELDGNLFLYEQGINPTNAFVEFGGGNGTITINSTATTSIGNIVVELVNDEIELTSDLSVGRFGYRHGGVNLGPHNLKIDVLDLNPEEGADDNVRLRTINDGSAQNEEFIFGVNGSSANQFFYSSGNASDGGLSLKVPRQTNVDGIDGTDNVSADPNFADIHYEYQNRNLLWFPVGIDGKYTPAIAYLHNTGTTDGDEYITVRPVDAELKTTDLSGGDILSYYWNVDFEGYASSEEPTVSWLFQYDDADVDAGTESNYVPGKVLDDGAYTRSDDGDTDAVKDGGDAGEEGDIIGDNPRNVIIFNGSTNATTDDINSVNEKVFNATPSGGSTQVNSDPTNTNWQNAFPGTGFTLESANYTAGAATRFVGAPQTFYVRVTNGYNNSPGGVDAWNNGSNWSLTSHTGAAAGDYPQAGDIAIVRAFATSGERKVILGITNSSTGVDVEVAKLIFEDQNVNNGGEEDNRIMIAEDASVDFGIVEGDATFQAFLTSSSTPTFNDTDFGDFVSQADNGARFNFYGNSDGVLTLPSEITEYPNVRFEGNNNAAIDRFYQFPSDATVRDLIVDSRATFRMNRNVIVTDDFRIGSYREGFLQFDGTNGAVTLTVADDFQMRSDGDNRVFVNDSGTGLEHKIIVRGDISFNSNTVTEFDLFTDLSGGDNVILELGTDADAAEDWNNEDGIVPELYKLVMNGGSDISTTFTMNTGVILPAATSTFQPLEVVNGLLIVNESSNDWSIANGSDFLLPNTANSEASSGSGGIEIRQGTLRVEGDDTGVVLDGLLRVNGGELDMDDATSNGNNFIEYSASGNAELEVSAGTLTVGSHVRRSTLNASGVLQYRQTGGTVEVGTQAAPLASRGLFEVLNTGSEFTLTGGNFTLVRQNGTSPTVAALLLEPTDYDVTGSTINIGGTATPASQTIGINSAIPLNNVAINTTNSPVAQVTGRNIMINGMVTINTGATLDANGWDISLGGNFVNDGTFTANGNTTIFSGASAQQISGSASGGTTFYNMTQSGANTLSLSSHDITVANDLHLESGTFDDAGSTLTLLGNMIHDGTHTTSAIGGEGIVFAGSSQQQLTRSASGISSFGKLTVSNSSGVKVPDGNGYNFIVNESLRLSAGVFDIGSSLLTIAADATIEEVSTFGSSNMIQTNSSFTDNGVQRYYNTISTSTDLVFPIGQAKYTPVVFNITSSDAGSITVRPANEIHPSIIEDAETPEIVDADNVLQYHWIVKAENIASLSGTATMTYDEADVAVTPPYNESDYIPARIYEDDTFWDKSLPTTNVNTTSNIVQFPFSSATDADVTGDYTAGVPDAIPDEIPTYETTGNGNYTAQASWSPVGSSPAVTDGVGPVGAIIIVKNGDVVTLNGNNVRVYRTEIETGGTLEIDGTFGHRLGTVTGDGGIRISSNTASAVLPAGVYDDFFNCTGGGLEYAGAGSYDVLGGITSLRDLTFSGSGARTMPNNAVTVCNNLTVNGPAVDNANDQTITVQNDFLQSSGTYENGNGTLSVSNNLNVSGGTFSGGTGNKAIGSTLTLNAGTLNVGSNGIFSVGGNLTYSGGTFYGGSGNAVLSLVGSSTQTVSGTFTGAATFHRLQINNGAGVNVVGNAEVSTELRLTNGIVNNGTNTLTLAETTTVTPVGGSSSSYVNGQLRKVIASGNDFTFPIGKGRYAPLTLDNVTSSGTLTWRAEYFAENAQTAVTEVDNLDPSNVGETIETISHNEYWIVSDDAGTAPTGTVTAEVGLSWDIDSDVSSNTTDYDDLRVMWWDDAGSHWDNAGRSSHSGNQSFGRLYASSSIAFSEKVVTLGSTSTANPLPVELISFKAVAKEQSVVLHWETASEVNNDYFEVQRSVDGINFKKIGEVVGGGNSNQVLRYEFEDKLPIAGIAYYQLKQVDYDGQFDYSEKVSVEWISYGEQSAFVELDLYPNPAPRGEAKLRVTGLQSNSAVQVKLLDMFGRVHLQQVVESSQLSQRGYLIQPRARLSAGVYVVSVQQGELVHQKTLIVR